MAYPLIFSDLDGTLLNHHDYSFQEAVRALEEIRERKIPLILNTSKTIPEVTKVREALYNHHPFVVENGAAALIPQGYFPGCEKKLTEHIFGSHRDDFLPVIHNIRSAGNYSFKGFADFTAAQISAETGLSLDESENAKQRIASEPIQWLDDPDRMKQFQQELERNNLRLIKGGRFWHVMGDADKATAMNWLVAQYRKHKSNEIVVIALGDSQNDRLMLEQADIAAVIRSSTGGHLSISKPVNSVVYTDRPGAAGWQEAVDKIFKRLDTGYYYE